MRKILSVFIIFFFSLVYLFSADSFTLLLVPEDMLYSREDLTYYINCEAELSFLSNGEKVSYVKKNMGNPNIIPDDQKWTPNYGQPFKCNLPTHPAA